MPIFLQIGRSVFPVLDNFSNSLKTVGIRVDNMDKYLHRSLDNNEHL